MNADETRHATPDVWRMHEEPFFAEYAPQKLQSWLNYARSDSTAKLAVYTDGVEVMVVAFSKQGSSVGLTLPSASSMITLQKRELIEAFRACGEWNSIVRERLARAVAAALNMDGVV